MAAVYNRASDFLSSISSGPRALFLGPSYEDLSEVQSLQQNANLLQGQGDARMSSLRGYLDESAVEADEASVAVAMRVPDEASSPLTGAISAPPAKAKRQPYCVKCRLYTIMVAVSLLFFYWLVHYLLYRRSPTFSEDLARSNSMKAVSARGLTFPSTPLSSEDSTNWIQKNWPTKRGTTQFLKFVKDPVGWSGETVLEVDFPAGSYAGGEIDGGVSSLPLGVFGKSRPMRAMVSYDIAFSSGFDFVKGGKLPGLFGGNSAEHCSGGQHSDQCFNLRLMWRTGGMGEVYAYIPTYSSFCDSTEDTLCDDAYGTSLNRGAFNFTNHG